ncbi:uncharacterized protein DMAD_13784 [Drosophila madeirensis]
MAGAGHVGCKATAALQPTHSRLSRSDLVSVLSISHSEEESLLRSPEPGTSSLRREGPKRSREEMKAKAQYKAVFKIQSRFRGKANLSAGEHANKVEEMLVTKTQRSAKSATTDTGEQAEARAQERSPSTKIEKV